MQRWHVDWREIEERWTNSQWFLMLEGMEQNLRDEAKETERARRGRGRGAVPAYSPPSRPYPRLKSKGVG
jgi:hypothetical protein